MCRCLYGKLTYIPSGIPLGVALPDHMVGVSILFSTVVMLSYIPTKGVWGFLFPHMIGGFFIFILSSYYCCTRDTLWHLQKLLQCILVEFTWEMGFLDEWIWVKSVCRSLYLKKVIWQGRYFCPRQTEGDMVLFLFVCLANKFILWSLCKWKKDEATANPHIQLDIHE
jgi:hypothetical protein